MTAGSAAGLLAASVLLLGACGGMREPEQLAAKPSSPAAKTTARAPQAPSPLRPLVFGRVVTKQSVVALTFDCCQTQKPAGFDEPLVRYLIRNRVPATFFLGGRWIESHPDAVKLLASTPFFELGNHSYIHPHMAKQTPEQMRQELVRTQELLHKSTGRWATEFRPPYGEWDSRVVAEAAKAGMRTVMWSVATGDPDPHASAASLVAEVRKVKPGGIIIMHANGRGWHTAKALPEMLAWLKKKGLKPVTVSELLKAGSPVSLEAHK
jgi:peptidoglycan/xylan/chitin deacetylase (PgdA/CDA1 family)